MAGSFNPDASLVSRAAATTRLGREIIPLVPIAKFCAVGGRCTTMRGAQQFQKTIWAPAHPCPVPIQLRFMAESHAFGPSTVTLSHNAPDDHR